MFDGALPDAPGCTTTPADGSRRPSSSRVDVATLTFLGAARTVTGSKHLLDVGPTRVLVDCGLFQGLKAIRERNWEPFAVPPSSIDVACSRMPTSITAGTFRGSWRRVSRAASSARAARRSWRRLSWLTPGGLQEEDAERANRKGYTKHRPALALFTEADAARAAMQLQPVGYNRPMPIAPGIELEFLNAGHLLGSAYARITVAAEARTILFGGDLGRYGRPVLPDPSPVPDADIVLMESTYGDRVHEPDDEGKHLARVVNETFERKGEDRDSGLCLGAGGGVAVLGAVPRREESHP